MNYKDADQNKIERRRGFFGKTQKEKFPKAIHHFAIYHNGKGKARMIYKFEGGIQFIKNLKHLKTRRLHEMFDDYEFYQGVVLRNIIVGAGLSIFVRPFVREGRISAFVINSRIGVFVKHSAKLMPPWRFTFTLDQIADLLDLEAKFFKLVCCFGVWRRRACHVRRSKLTWDCDF